MQLIDEGFSGWYKKYSALALVVIGAFNAAWAGSPEFQGIVGEQGLAIGNAIVAAGGFIGRFIKQTAG